MASTGWKIAGTGVSYDATGSGRWVSPANITNTNLSSATADPQNSQKGTGYLVAKNFGFLVPSDKVVLGVEARISRVAWNNDVKDRSVLLILSNVLSTGEDKAVTHEMWPRGTMSSFYDSIENITYGSPSDTWGELLTPADVNSQGFGVALQVESINKGVAEVVTVWMNVHYGDVGNTFVRDGGIHKKGVIYVRDNGVYRKGSTIVRDGGIWKS